MDKYTKQQLESMLQRLELQLRDLEIQKAFLKHYIEKADK